MPENPVPPAPPASTSTSTSTSTSAQSSAAMGARRSTLLRIVVVLGAICVAIVALSAIPGWVSARELLGEVRNPGEAAFVAAHRGERSVAPENTLPAIQAAIDGDFDYVEVDVALTSDGHAVLLHDDTLDRTTDGAGPLAQHTLAQVRQLDAGAWFDAAFAGTRVPTVDEFLVLLASSHKRGLIELKGEWTPLAVQAFAASVHEQGLGDRVAIASFDARTLAFMEEAAPQIPRLAILRTLPDDTVAAARALGVRGIIASSKAVLRSPEVIEQLHAAGLRIAVYTLNDDAKWQRALELGVDGIITDTPHRLRDWLQTEAPDAG